MSDPCPYCGAKSVDVTTISDRIGKYICTGVECHEWTDCDIPEPDDSEPEQKQPEPQQQTGFIRRLIARF